ncbi:MAG: hypothetical protein ACJAVK_002197, partial [Akkermansiaceae bacterium]
SLGDGVVEDLLEDGLWGFAFGEGFVGEADAVEADVFGEGEEVLGDGVVAAVDEGAGAGGFEERDAGAGGAAHFEVGVPAGALNDVDDVLEEDFADVDVVGRFHGVDKILRGADGLVGDEVELGAGNRSGAFCLDAKFEVSAENFFFFRGRGVAEAVAEHEAIELGFREFEGSGLLDGVLSRDDEERSREGKGFGSEGDFALLHRFEEGALDLGGGAVDLVGEEEVGKDGAFVSAEVTGLFVEDLGAEDIGREEVDGELDALEVEMEGLGDGVDEEGLGESGHAFEEEVPGGQEGDDGALDDDILTDDDLANAIADVLDVGGGFSGGGFISGHGLAMRNRLVLRSHSLLTVGGKEGKERNDELIARRRSEREKKSPKRARNVDRVSELCISRAKGNRAQCLRFADQVRELKAPRSKASDFNLGNRDSAREHPEGMLGNANDTGLS